jgi:hypothetical protein
MQPLAGLPTPAGAPAPVNPFEASVGGILALRSLAQTLAAESKDRATEANNQPYIQGLARQVRKCWDEARAAKLQTVEPRLLQCLRQRKGEYDPEVEQRIKQQGQPPIYMMLSSVKARGASSWIRDVLTPSDGAVPISVRPTPIADLPPDRMAAIEARIQREVEEMSAQGVLPQGEDLYEFLEAQKAAARAQAQEEAAKAAARMQDKMLDQLAEGGFGNALSQFIDDIVTFPAAVLKGPVVRRRKRIAWEPDGQGGFAMQVVDDMRLEWERVDPFMIYPSPQATTIDDGYLIERHRMTVGDLTALIGVDGYNEDAIRAVIAEHGRGGLHEWLTLDVQKASAEGKAPLASANNSERLIDALQFWGPVRGADLVEWGLTEAEVPDADLDYPTEVWLIGNWVIRAVINPDPLARRPYYKACYEILPGAFWGNGVLDLARDTQSMCNGAARALAANMGIASGPQAWVNIDRLPPGEPVENMYPWKIWQTTGDPMGNSAPPLEFFQPGSNAAELMGIYEKFSVLADEYTGVPRYMTGDSPAGGAGRTASGMSMLMTNAGKSIKQVIANIDTYVLAPLAERLWYYNMRYSDDPDLKGDVAIVARGASSLVVKETVQQRRIEFLQATANPIDMQIVGMSGRAAVLREAAKVLDLNVDDIVPSPDLVKARQQAQQQVQQREQQRMQAMQPTGGPPQQPQPDGHTLMDGAPVTNHFPSPSHP